MTASLPENANLRQLKNQAKDLVKSHALQEPGVPQRVRDVLPEWTSLNDEAVFDGRFSLKDAQRTIAREYGFETWTELAHSLAPNAHAHLQQLNNEVIDLVQSHSLRKRGVDGRLRRALPEWAELADEPLFARRLSVEEAQATVAYELGYESWTAMVDQAGEKPASILGNLRQLPLDSTLIGVFQGVASYYGFDASPATTFGGTGYGFLINIHEVICPSGPLSWRRRRFDRLAKNIGIDTKWLGFYHNHSSREARRKVQDQLCEAIDAGIACSLYNEEHQIITGYDDTGFYSIGPYADHLRRRLTFDSWEEWKDVYADFYIHYRCEPADRVSLVRDSLDFAIDVFRKPSDLADEGYAVGPGAYEFWLAAIDQHGTSFGNTWNAEVWSECREYAGKYLIEIGEWFPQVSGEASELARSYEKISKNLRSVSDAKMPAERKKQIVAETRDMELSTVDKLSKLRARI